MMTYNVTCISKNEYRLSLRFETEGAEPLTIPVDEVDVFSVEGGVNRVIAAAHDIRELRRLLLKGPKLELVLPHTIRVLPDFFSSNPEEVLFVQKDVSGRGQTWTTLCLREDIAMMRPVGEIEKVVERMDDLNTFMGRVERQAVIGLLCDMKCIQTLANTRDAFRLRTDFKKAREALAAATDISTFDQAARDARNALQSLTDMRDFWKTASIEDIIKRGE